MNLFHISHCVKNIDKPTYISLGSNCSIAFHMQKLGLKSTTFPFDWIETPNILLLSKLIHNNFNEILDYFTFIGTSYSPMIENNWNEGNQIMLNIKNSKYDIIFKHDFASVLYPHRKNHSEIQKYYKSRISEFLKIMQDTSKYKKLFRIGKLDDKNRLKFLNDTFINKGFSNYTIYLVPDNISLYTNADTFDTLDTVPIIDISQVDPIHESWKKNHYNWVDIFNSPLHNY